MAPPAPSLFGQGNTMKPSQPSGIFGGGGGQLPPSSIPPSGSSLFGGGSSMNNSNLFGGQATMKPQLSTEGLFGNGPPKSAKLDTSGGDGLFDMGNDSGRKRRR